MLAFVTTVSGYKTKCEESPFTVSSTARPREKNFLTRRGLQVQTVTFEEKEEPKQRIKLCRPLTSQTVTVVTNTLLLG